MLQTGSGGRFLSPDGATHNDALTRHDEPAIVHCSLPHHVKTRRGWHVNGGVANPFRLTNFATLATDNPTPVCGYVRAELLSELDGVARAVVETVW